jgi:hypothetical protein
MRLAKSVLNPKLRKSALRLVVLIWGRVYKIIQPIKNKVNNTVSAVRDAETGEPQAAAHGGAKDIRETLINLMLIAFP